MLKMSRPNPRAAGATMAAHTGAVMISHTVAVGRISSARRRLGCGSVREGRQLTAVHLQASRFAKRFGASDLRQEDFW